MLGANKLKQTGIKTDLETEIERKSDQFESSGWSNPTDTTIGIYR